MAFSTGQINQFLNQLPTTSATPTPTPTPAPTVSQAIAQIPVNPQGSYSNLPASLNWIQYLAPGTADPVYVSQLGNQTYYVGPDNQLYSGALSSYGFTSNNGQNVTNPATATYVSPNSASKISWTSLFSNPLFSALTPSAPVNTQPNPVQPLPTIPATQSAPAISPSSTVTPPASASPSVGGLPTTLAQALASLASGGAPQASVTASTTDPNAASSTTAIPVDTSTGPSSGVILVAVVIVAALAWYWWKHRAV